MTPGQVARHAATKKTTNNLKIQHTTRGYAKAVNSIMFQMGDNVMNDDPFDEALHQQVLKTYKASTQSNTAVH